MRWWQIRKRDADLERELRSDLELEAEEQRENGLAPEEAHFAAQRAFGNTVLIREHTHEAWGLAPFERLWQDVRYGLRQLVRNPGFTAVAVMTLALGVAINTSIFSAVSAFLLRKPPVKDPDTLCAISSKNLLRGFDLVGVSALDFESWERQNKVFQNMAAAERGSSFTITGKTEPESVHGDLVTPGYFAVLGVTPGIGRTFLPDEDRAGNNHVVILSSALWQERYASDPNASGKDLEINGAAYRIVGVMPSIAETTTISRPELWVPLVFSTEDLAPSARSNHFIDLVLGRLKTGVTVKQAQTEMDSIARRLEQSYPTNKDWGVTVLTLQKFNSRSLNVRNAMMLLMIAVGLVLLIACTNVAGLLLSRGACRAHELAVRSALGASRTRIVRQMLTESLLIGIAGGGVGLLLSFLGVRLLRSGFDFNELGKQMGAGLRIDLPTLLFTLSITLLTTIVFGLVPAIRSSKVPPSGTLSQTGRTSSTGVASSRIRRVLVTGEVALAVILLTAACVDIREVTRELREPNGFNPQGLLSVNLDVSGPRYKQLDARIALFEQVTQKIRDIAEVEDAAPDSCIPMGCFYSTNFTVAGRDPQPSSAPLSSDFSVVGPEYFRTMQIPIMRGRGFSTTDNARGSVVAIVNQEFARRFFSNEDVIGKQIEVDDGNHKWAQVVGIVGNVNSSVGQVHSPPRVYESYLQVPVNGFTTMGLVVRSRVPRAALAPLLRQAVWSLDDSQPVGIRTMQDLMNENLGGDKLLVGLMSLFGCLALGLAGLGIYGIVSYSITQRTCEIGIRFALGAKKRDILRLVLREGGMLIGIGCAIGIVPSLLLPRAFSGLLNGFALQGLQAVFAAAVMVAVASWVATYIPARRAMKLDPMRALRTE
ncbi:MAG: ABC transporter permease [Terracidiphilus sp.]